MKEQAILHCIFLIFYATSSITEAICVEKVFIDSEQTVNVRVNENCLNFVQLESTEFLTQVSCENIEPYHENCHGRVLVLRANTDTTLVYCIVKPASLTTIVTKVFSALDSLEFYLEGEDLQHENVDCSVSTIKILPNPNGRSLSFDLFDEPEEEDPMVKPSFNVFSHLPSLFSSNDIFAKPEPKLQCGQIQVIPDLNQRILGGKEATENNYNWMVLMVTQLPNGQRFMCGGNIISTTKVLTAAHCVQNAKSVRIYPGIHQLSHAKTYLKMKSFIVHEKYGFPNHDIAIVTIEKPFEFNDKVGPVCLPSHLNSNVEAKENMIGLGWGRTSTNAWSNVLKENVFSVILDTTCKAYFGNVFNSKIVMCTQNKPGESTCQGDSGSSLGRIEEGRFVLMGIISFTGQDCSIGSPTGYTEVIPHLEWIKKHS